MVSIRYGKNNEIRTFSFQDFQNAFSEIDISISTGLRTLRKEVESSFDGVLFAGGFCQFHLVREAIKRELKEFGQDLGYIEELNDERSRYAIALGSALIANDEVAVDERLMETLGLVTYAITEDHAGGVLRQEKLYLPILSRNRGLGPLTDYQFAQTPLTLFREFPSITVYTEDASGNRVDVFIDSSRVDLWLTREKTLSIVPGMRIDKNNKVCIRFKDLNGGLSNELKVDKFQANLA